MAYMVAIDESDKAYAAGLIDGEGCIDVGVNKIIPGIRKSPQYYVRVGIHITNRQVLEFLQIIWGGSIRERKNTNPKWKKSYDWKISSSSAISFLKDIQPHSKVKRAEILTILEFPSYTGSRDLGMPKNIQNKRMEIKLKLQDLKKGDN